ncbi:MAG: hypothetical protein MSA38_02890 [Bacteroidales bacterium]|nr:hypothetical protein [Bacteroidales bacterium]
MKTSIHKLASEHPHSLKASIRKLASEHPYILKACITEQDKKDNTA